MKAGYFKESSRCIIGYLHIFGSLVRMACIALFLWQLFLVGYTNYSNMDTRFSDKYVKLLLGTTPGQKHFEIKSICLRTWTEKGQDTTHTSTIENIICTITLFLF